MQRMGKQREGRGLHPRCAVGESESDLMDSKEDFVMAEVHRPARTTYRARHRGKQECRVDPAADSVEQRGFSR
jgi:hypothetical protein